MSDMVQGYIDGMLAASEPAAPEPIVEPVVAVPPAVDAAVPAQPADAAGAPSGAGPQRTASVIFPDSDALTDARRETGTPVEWVLFELERQCYALDVHGVREIVRPPLIEAVPHAGPAVCGVANLRGAVVAVFDARQLIGLPTTALSPASRVVLLEHEGDVLGLLVDRVLEILRFDAEQAEAPPLVGAATPQVVKLLRQRDRLVQCVSAETLFGGVAA